MNWQAVECPVCKKLCEPHPANAVQESALIAHGGAVDDEGFAIPTEAPECTGSWLLGRVVDVPENMFGKPFVRQPIDAWLVSLDETRNYFLEQDEEARVLIKSIRCVYLFNRNERTHCCELTPSYWLRHMYDVVELSELGEILDEESQAELRQKWGDGQCDRENDKYVHCHDIERLIEKNDPAVVVQLGATGVSYAGTSYEAQMDALVEHYSANPPL